METNSSRCGNSFIQSHQEVIGLLKHSIRQTDNLHKKVDNITIQTVELKDEVDNITMQTVDLKSSITVLTAKVETGND